MLTIARLRGRRPTALGMAGLIAIAVLGSPVAVAADLSVSAAEQEVVNLLNAERAKAGLIALRVDSRLSAIARARSTDMATKHYFSHTQPDGRNVFDYIKERGIAWYGAGEIIAWNNWSTLADSAVQAKNAWMGSSSHRSIILSGSYNYFGLGVAKDTSTGRWIWTGVFLKGPDRTGGWVTYTPVTEGARSGLYRYVTVAWRGGDVRLAVLTSGFLHYQVQVRTDEGPWKVFSSATTSASRSLRIWKGHTYVFRTRACDRAGNCGPWYNLDLVG